LGRNKGSRAVFEQGEYLYVYPDHKIEEK